MINHKEWAELGRAAERALVSMQHVLEEQKKMRRMLTHQPWVQDVAGQKRPKHHRK